jgi:BirA family biotin operon repressor/biotin-[acetyl-CoA-carboxylase] ligase
VHRVHVPETDSTNTLAAAEATRRWARPLPTPVVVSADRQTAGRGRDGRHWASPVGGAYLSVAYPWWRHATDRGETIPLIASLAVRAALHELTGLPDERWRIKWPNDLLLDGLKVAGILCERRIMGDAASSDRPAADRDAVIVGVGVNVLGSPADLGSTRLPATTLAAHLPDPPEPRDVIDAIGKRIVLRLDRLAEHGFTDHDHAALDAALAWKQQRIVFHDHQRPLEATLLGIDPAGRLLLQTHPDAPPTAHHAGELSRLEPSPLHPTA